MERTEGIPTTSLKRGLLSRLQMRTEPAIQTANNTDVLQLPPKRRRRTAISTEQLLKLEAMHDREKWPSRAAKEALATELNTSTHFVNVWFQNKRSRVRKALQEESELAAIKIKERLTSSAKMNIPIAPKPSRPPYPARSSSTGSALPQLGGGLCRIVDSSYQYNKRNLVQAPFSETLNNYQLLSDETTNDQRAWSKFVCNEKSPRLYEYNHCVDDVGHTTCVSQRRNDVLTTHYYQLPCHPLTSNPSHPLCIFRNKTNLSTSDDREVLWQEDVCLLQILLYMMMISGGHWNLIQDEAATRLAIDACLYGLKLRDGRTLVIDKDYGFGLREDIAIIHNMIPTSQ